MLMRPLPLPRRGGIRKSSKGIMCWQLYREIVLALVLDLLCSCRSGLRKESGALKPGHGVSSDCQSAVLFAWVWS